jgi:hypothetical protein
MVPFRKLTFDILPEADVVFRLVSHAQSGAAQAALAHSYHALPACQPVEFILEWCGGDDVFWRNSAIA